MAITIMGDLFVATVLLLVVPALYALWFRVPNAPAWTKRAPSFQMPDPA
jgi:hypothetical protein